MRTIRLLDGDLNYIKFITEIISTIILAKDIENPQTEDMSPEEGESYGII